MIAAAAISVDFPSEHYIKISDLSPSCLTDSGLCGSFQTADGYCPRFGTNGCPLREVMIFDV